MLGFGNLLLLQQYSIIIRHKSNWPARKSLVLVPFLEHENYFTDAITLILAQPPTQSVSQ